MSDKSYSLAEVSEILHISPDTIYKWENQMPQIKPRQSEGGRRYDEWELDLLRNTKRFFFTYNQEIRMTRVAVERWISKNPRPHLLLDDPTPTTSPSIEALKTSKTPTPNQAITPLSPSEVSTSKSATPSSPTLSSLTPIPSVSSTLSSQPTPTPIPTATATATATSISPVLDPFPSSSTSSSNSLSSSSRATPSPRLDSSEVQTWKRAFNQTQTELNETKTELARARENLQKQHALIKHLQADFNALKELIRKEIYDLRDLFIDNQ